MKISSLYRSVLAVNFSAAVLAGCAGSQALSGMNSQTGALTASDGDLVYVTAGHAVDVYTYPGGALVGTLTSGFSDATGLCADGSGNVWIVNPSYLGTSTLVEYAHGGTAPIATLQDGNKNIPEACAVDPLTGNLAVANMNANVAIYVNAQGSPTYYSTAGFAENVRTITYDGGGDLYIRSFTKKDRTAAAWLPKGGSSVEQFHVKKRGYYDWDGKELVIDAGGLPATALTRYKLNGATGRKVGKVELNTCQEGGVFSVEGSELAVICGSGITYYDYPSGGDPIALIPGVSAGGVAISVASKAERPHP